MITYRIRLISKKKLKKMKRIYTAVLLSLLICASEFAQDLKVATYNIRYASSNDIGNLWQDRAPYVAALVRFHDFDVFGTQEGLPEQLTDLEGMLPTYSRYG